MITFPLWIAVILANNPLILCAKSDGELVIPTIPFSFDFRTEFDHLDDVFVAGDKLITLGRDRSITCDRDRLFCWPS